MIITVYLAVLKCFVQNYTSKIYKRSRVIWLLQTILCLTNGNVATFIAQFSQDFEATKLNNITFRESCVTHSSVLVR